MIKKKKKSYLLNLILLSLAISPAFALGDGNRNLLLIGVMFISPIIILNYAKLDHINPGLLLFIGSIVLFPLLFHPETMRWSTVLYSMMFGFTFIAFGQLLRQEYFSILHYIIILRYLIYAYFIVLLIQQFCVLTGLPIFNLSNYDLNEPWKLNSLSAEPSHSARIVSLLMYSYITIKELVTNRKYSFKFDLEKDKWVWIAFIWTMVTMLSATAILFIMIVLLKFLRFKTIFPFFILTIIFIFSGSSIQNKSVQRTNNVILATLTLNESAILKADHSAAMRIVPSIVAGKKIGLNSLNDWFGNGVDFTVSFISDEVPGLPEGTSGGGMFQIWLEYGFISFALFVVFSLSNTYRKRDYLSFLYWFLLVFAYGVNNQIVWLCIVLLYTNKYFYKKNKILITSQTYLKN
tara:strand:+ start:815 stop:2032 length:1218 start_codon:yes stop_codon:yes gene_type:complete